MEDKLDNTETAADGIDLSVRKKLDGEPIADTLDLSIANTKAANVEFESEAMETDSNEFTSAPENGRLIEKLINGFPNSGPEDEEQCESMDVQDEPLPPLPLSKELSDEELKIKLKRMRRLKQELRNEEMKLVLLKKLRQSQLMKENIVAPINQNNHSAPISHSASKLLNNMSSRNGSVPPSGHTPNVTVSHNRTANHGIKSNSVLNPPIGRSQNHGSICPPPLGMNQRNNSNQMPSAAHSSSLRPGPLSSMNRTPVTTPPNVVLGYPIQDIRNQTNPSNSLLNTHQSVSDE